MIDFHSVASKWMDEAKQPDAATYDPRKYRTIEATVRKLIIGGHRPWGRRSPASRSRPATGAASASSLLPRPSEPWQTAIHLS
jgi:hypothetical protein